MEAEAEEEVRGWSWGGAGLQSLPWHPVGPTLFLSPSSLSPLCSWLSWLQASPPHSVLPPVFSLSRCLPMGLSLPQPSDSEYSG